MKKFIGFVCFLCVIAGIASALISGNIWALGSTLLVTLGFMVERYYDDLAGTKEWKQCGGNYPENGGIFYCRKREGHIGFCRDAGGNLFYRADPTKTRD